jgi:hypothetical protein
MSSFTFDIPADATPMQSAEQSRYEKAQMDKIQRMQLEARLERQEEELRAARNKSRVVTLRMPVTLIEGLDIVASDAATNRGHLLRQIAADYLNYIRQSGIAYQGSLLSFRDNPSRKV